VHHHSVVEWDANITQHITKHDDVMPQCQMQNTPCLVFISPVQAIISVYVALFAKRDLGEAAVLNLLLTANNTFIIGLPIMNATFGSTGRFIALLTGMSLCICNATMRHGLLALCN
jgi:predicted permease